MLPMLALLGLMSDLGLEDTSVTLQYACSDPNFIATVTDDGPQKPRHIQITGTLMAPMPGFSYSYRLIGTDGGQALSVISAGQKISGNKPYGRSMPAIQNMQIDQEFNVPQGTNLLRFRVEGLSPVPGEFYCNITPVPQNQGQH